MRLFTILGPSGAGKTTLVQALASLDDKRGKALSIPGVASVSSFGFMGEDWAAVDVVGGAENLASVGAALAVSDIAVICVPADAESAVLAAPFLRRVEELEVPAIIFINRIDSAQHRIAEIVAALQAYSRHHIVLREVPIRDGGTITGFVDLVSERAWKFEEGKHSALIEMPDSVKDREAAARTELLESYADLDDHLMEELIEDRQPLAEEVYAVAARALRDNAVIECFIGSASKGHGITRLMKSLRHDAPGVEQTRSRFGAGTLAVGALADQLKHLGKTVLVRALEGSVGGGARLGGADLGSITDLDAKTPLGQLAAGQIGLAVKSDHLSAGQAFSRDTGERLAGGGAASPFRRIIAPGHDKDDSRLLAALGRLAEIDPALGL
ncbi:MAG: GTP-binding protein, partial [Tabrizicola sp.]|uniref:GTP-binding protein n=1 Tax=Tabrizicola sp. TaxID=2005166 RepID=UPI003BB09C9C